MPHTSYIHPSILLSIHSAVHLSIIHLSVPSNHASIYFMNRLSLTRFMRGAWIQSPLSQSKIQRNTTMYIIMVLNYRTLLEQCLPLHSFCPAMFYIKMHQILSVFTVLHLHFYIYSFKKCMLSFQRPTFGHDTCKWFIQLWQTWQLFYGSFCLLFLVGLFQKCFLTLCQKCCYCK